jgi:hypothetical protein
MPSIIRIVPSIIRIVGRDAGPSTPFDGQYLVAYDPGQYGFDPTGRPMLAHIECSADRAEAKVYADPMEAWAEWARVDPRNPIRPDGKPNRPLTFFTITVESADPRSEP